MHAVVGLLTALRQRDDDGRGRLVEVSLVEAAMAAAAEPIVEQSATGERVTRAGNSSWGASPQGVYACAGDEQWAAISAGSDEQRKALLACTGAESDAELAAWCATRAVDDVVAALADAGVPAADVVLPNLVWDNEQLRARGFVERVEHPVVGAHDLPSIPFRLSSRAGDGWLRSPAPTLGQHNRDVLVDELGLDDTELERLERDGVIGTRPAPAA